jgi:calcineurin-like phosphoesterase
LGDIVGGPGRKVVKTLLPELREYYKIDLVIANGENAAGGRGITPAVLKELFNSKIDIVTTGNHIWDRKEILGIIKEETRLLRPANMSLQAPGKGVALVPCGEYLIGILNLMGRIFMTPVD